MLATGVFSSGVGGFERARGLDNWWHRLHINWRHRLNIRESSHATIHIWVHAMPTRASDMYSGGAAINKNVRTCNGILHLGQYDVPIVISIASQMKRNIEYCRMLRIHIYVYILTLACNVLQRRCRYINIRAHATAKATMSL